MRLRSAKSPPPWHWGVLPPELRTLILQAIAREKLPGWASLAAVCSEWQQVLESYNFRKLKLGSGCMKKFKRLLLEEPNKKLLIKHICLNIELPRYTLECCSNKQGPVTNYEGIVEFALRKFFNILKCWGQEGDLTLELNVYSPSDAEHWFKNIYLYSDDVENPNNTDKSITGIWKHGVPYHDLQHGWDNGRQRTYAPEEAVKQLFRRIQMLWFGGPQLEMVKCLIVRRQLRRCISPEGMECILSHLKGLEALWYEPWEPYKDGTRDVRWFYDGSLAASLRATLPPMVKTLVVFEDSYTFYNQFGQRPARISLFSPEDTRAGLERLFVTKSLGLRHLAVAFLVTAERVLHEWEPTWRWPILESLALTSPLLHSGSDGDKIEALLCKAAHIVPQVQHLQTLVLWNGGKANACAFIFHRNTTNRNRDKNASITWRGNWRFSWTPRILECWNRAAKSLGVDTLDFRHELIEADVHSHGDAIHHLKLPCSVITPESLWQIRREAYTLEQNL